jgi:hypothetical protein
LDEIRTTLQMLASKSVASTRKISLAEVTTELPSKQSGRSAAAHQNDTFIQ